MYSGSHGSWHDNQILTKISQNCTDFSSVQEIEDVFLLEKSGFWVSDFKYAISIFKGTKGVAMTTKFRKNKPKLHKFPFLARNRGIFRMFSRAS